MLYNCNCTLLFAGSNGPPEATSTFSEFVRAKIHARKRYYTLKFLWSVSHDPSGGLRAEAHGRTSVLSGLPCSLIASFTAQTRYVSRD